MKKILLMAAISCMLSIQSFAQTDLWLNGGALLCEDLTVIVTAKDAACNYIATSQPFTLQTAFSPTTPIDLNDPTNWQSWSPTGFWEVDEIFIINTCGWAPGTGGTVCASTKKNATTMHTGITGFCPAITSSDCFEYDTACGGCSIGDDVNITLSVMGNDIIVTAN